MSLLLLLSGSGGSGTVTKTWTADVTVQTSATAQWTAQVSIVGTLLRRHLSGKVTYDDCSSASKFDSVSGAATSTGGMLKVATASTAEIGAVRGVNDPTGLSAPFSLRVRDCAVSVDVYWQGANTATGGLVGIYTDSNNSYMLSVAPTAGGTSTLYSRKSGVQTSRSTASEGAAATTSTRVKFYREGDTFGAMVDNTTFAEWTDSSSPIAPSAGMYVFLGGPNTGSGTSDNRFDNFDVSLGNTIRVTNLPGGASARIYESPAQYTAGLVAQGVASAGVVELDCAGIPFPFTGYLQLYSDGASYTTQLTDGYLPASDFRGGDEFVYDADYQVVSCEGSSLYATSQYNTHNGVITSGSDVYGIFTGWDNRVTVFHGNTDLNTYTEYVVDGPYSSVLDMHDPSSIVQDSSGYFHITYGGTGTTVKYRKSSSPNDVSAWDAAADVTANTAGTEGALLIDQADVLYFVGVTTSTIYLDQVFYTKNTGAGWAAPTTIANAAGTYRFLLGDVTIGKESSGQKSIHMTVSGYDSSAPLGYPGDYKNIYYFRSTNAGANWKGLTGSNYTLPLSMTAGDLTAADHIYTGTGAYITNLGIDPDNTTIHLSSQQGALTAGGWFAAYYKQGNTTTGWDATGYEFTSDAAVDWPGGGPVIEKIGAQLIALCTNRYNLELLRFRSTDDGATWSSAVFQSSTPRLAGGTPSSSQPPQWHWPKITPTSSTGFKAYWHSRNSGYTLPTTTNAVSGEGVSSVYLADISALAITQWTATVTVASTVVAKTWTATATVQIASTAKTWAATVTVATTATTTATRPFTAPFLNTGNVLAAFTDTEPTTAPFHMTSET